MKKALLFLSIIIISTTAKTQNFTSNIGKEFWVAYGHHQFFEAESINTQNMTIYISVQNLPVGVATATVTIEVDSSDANYNNWFRRVYKIPANTVLSIDDTASASFLQSFSPACAKNFGPIPKGVTNSVGCGDYRLLDPLPPLGTGGEKVFTNKGIHITSDYPIVAYAHIYGSTNSGATMLIPVSSWGANYKTINSRQGNATAAFNFFYVMAANDNTPVKIIPSQKSRLGKPANVPIYVTLNKGQVYQYVGYANADGNGVELTASVVQSLDPTKPIAVFAGSSRTNGEYATSVSPGTRDNDMQQCFPQETWGKEFLTSPFGTASGYNNITPNDKAPTVYKIVGRDSNTLITINNRTPFLLNDSFYKFDNTIANKIVANKPIMVAQFMVNANGNNTLGDPEMIYLSPIERGINKTGFYRHVKQYIDVNYVNIIVPTDGLSSLTIDSVSYPFGANATTYLHPQDTNYAVVVKGWKSEKKQCIINCDKRFVGITYGLGSAESYGYNIGANFYLNTPNDNPYAKPKIAGYVFCDANNNGVKDATENYKANVKLQLSTGKYTFSNNNGYYEIEADSIGTYTLVTNAPNGYNALPVSSTYTFTKNDTTIFQNIALQSTATIEDFSINVIPLSAAAIAGQPYPYFVEYFNTGTQTINPNIDVTYNNYLLSYDSCTDATVVPMANGVATVANNFTPGERRAFVAFHTIKNSAQNGDTLKTNYEMFTPTKSINDSFYNIIENNVAAPIAIKSRQAISPTQISKGEGIDYTVRFKNEVSYAIKNIKITDTLDGLLQFNSVEVLGSSHLCKATVKGNTILFEMLNANLTTPKTNKIKSSGYIKFKIRPINNVAIGTIIHNKATVYFDYDNAVNTNIGKTIVNGDGVYKSIELLYFDAYLKDANTVLNTWQTIVEDNLKKFIVERSLNNKDFVTAKEIAAKGVGKYNFEDNIIALKDKTNRLYYRLKIIDNVGKISYTDTKQILLNANNDNGFNIFPNPANNIFTVDCNDTKTIEIIDYLGRTLITKNVNGDINKVNIESLSKGTYVVRVTTIKDNVFIKKLIVQ